VFNISGHLPIENWAVGLTSRRAPFIIPIFITA
jgi:hypothetical protein